MTVKLRFINTSSNVTDELEVSRPACDKIAEWYGGYHAGDDYTVEIDGVPIKTDLNGLLATDPHYSH